MARKDLVLSLLAVVAVVSTLWTGATAQFSCTNVLISMSPCLNYITGNSSTPASQCCAQLSSVVRSSPQCLCEVLSGSGSSLGININQTQALALPGACNVQTPPISSCNAASPVTPPEGTPPLPTTPTEETGSKEVPSTEAEGTSDGSSMKLSVLSLGFLLFAASYGSILTAY
ncbi:non-specific lipid transfer protein GPI-anchored 5-like [Mercurialis annua]|uniref:non-specific lipid transfer protein GPI-anchored 5-like n=1 Tax=Mercurialis annua TaxID=3986 RepID=UPI00215EF4B6|nr:non-specific lipid transfer protein GPI-anchored 5-like [Mercurialis annua]